MRAIGMIAVGLLIGLIPVLAWSSAFREEPTGYIPRNGEEKDILALLRRNEVAWNTNNVDLMMTTWHQRARIMAGFRRRLVDWNTYREGLSPRIEKIKDFRYTRIGGFMVDGVQASLRCMAEFLYQRKNGNWYPIQLQGSFRFIKENGSWFFWRQEY